MDKLTIKFYVDSYKGVVKRFLKNSKYRLRCRFRQVKEKDILYFVFEPNIKHPGLADRIKAIISLYNHCKKYNYKFQLYFETPFKLSDYLIPQFNWEMNLDDLEYSLLETKIINEQSMYPKPALKKGKQYHCYCYCGNEMPRIFPDTGYKWCDLFHELFKPCEELITTYNNFGIVPHTYISIHIRFVNALEQFENTFFDNHLKTQAERDNLISRCHKAIWDVIAANKGCDVYIFSDSKVFLQSLDQLPVKVLPTENISHVSEGANKDGQFKSFLDLYVISQSQKAYRFLAPELYNWSGYAKLAAQIGDISIEDKHV